MQKLRQSCIILVLIFMLSIPHVKPVNATVMSTDVNLFGKKLKTMLKTTTKIVHLVKARRASKLLAKRTGGAPDGMEGFTIKKMALATLGSILTGDIVADLGSCLPKFPKIKFDLDMKFKLPKFMGTSKLVCKEKYKPQLIQQYFYTPASFSTNGRLGSENVEDWGGKDFNKPLNKTVGDTETKSSPVNTINLNPSGGN